MFVEGKPECSPLAYAPILIANMIQRWKNVLAYLSVLTVTKKSVITLMLVPSNFLTEAPNQGRGLGASGASGPPPPPRGALAGKKGEWGWIDSFQLDLVYFSREFERQKKYIFKTAAPSSSYQITLLNKLECYVKLEQNSWPYTDALAYLTNHQRFIKWISLKSQIYVFHEIYKHPTIILNVGAPY